MTPVTATGIKGFLLWLKANQPGIYAKAAPQIAQLVPGAFRDYTAGLSGLADALTPIDVSAATDTTSLPAIDVASAADSGSTGASVTSTIGSIVNGIASLYLTKSQVDAQNSILQTQLARAQAGLAPLPVTTSAAGIPTIAASLGGAGSYLPLIAIGGGLILLATMMGKRRGH